jgi:hypothetical protein
MKNKIIKLTKRNNKFFSYPQAIPDRIYTRKNKATHYKSFGIPYFLYSPQGKRKQKME